MFTSCILKLTSICNLNCTYCYMFNLRDTRYEEVPNRMGLTTMMKTLEQIETYCHQQHLTEFEIILHGGEPSIWPYDCFVAFFAKVNEIRDNGVFLNLSMQTNAYRAWDFRLLDLLRDNGVSLGVSLDGPAWINDKTRITHRGGGSYSRIIENVEHLRAEGYGALLGGFLSVIQPELKPSEYYAWMQSLPITKVDVLWPIEFNLDYPPWQDIGELSYSQAPVYGQWLSQLFDLWWDADDPAIEIRSFANTISLLLGSTKHIDSLVNDTLNMLVVNTDGAIEYPDYLRGASASGIKSGLSVHHHSLLDCHQNDLFRILFDLGNSLPSECKGCSQRGICGGGFLPGRTNAESTLSHHRSVLCYDQYYFFEHARKRLVERIYQVA